MAIVSSSSRPPDPPSSDSESPTFMTLPVEIRLKIYEALLDKIKVKYTVQRHPTMHEYWRGETGRYKVVRRTPEPYHSFAILTASKKINEEAQNAAATCPVVWEVEGCMDHCSLDALLPETVVRRVCSIITDESFWYGCKGSLKCCFDRQAYSNLRHLELRGPPKRITMPLEVLMRLSGKDGFDGYQLSPEICVQVQNSWPSWTPQLAQIIVSGQLTIKIRCDMFIRRMPAPAFTRADTEISALVDLLWDENGMKVTEVFSWKQRQGGINRDRHNRSVHLNPGHSRRRNRRRRDEEDELSDGDNDEWEL